MTRHIMLDLETLGTKPGCVIRSIGAVAFDLQDMLVGPSFYMTVGHLSCLDAGLTVDPETEKWWAGQSIEARRALTVAPTPLLRVTDAFIAWFKAVSGKYVWAHGATFDPPILAAAIDALLVGGVEAPWDFRNVRDTRTIYHMLGVDLKMLPRNGTHHNALDDAKHQVETLFEGLRRLPEAERKRTIEALVDATEKSQ